MDNRFTVDRMFWSKGSNRQASQALLAKEKDALQAGVTCLPHQDSALSLSLSLAFFLLPAAIAKVLFHRNKAINDCAHQPVHSGSLTPWQPGKERWVALYFRLWRTEQDGPVESGLSSSKKVKFPLSLKWAKRCTLKNSAETTIYHPFTIHRTASIADSCSGASTMQGTSLPDRTEPERWDPRGRHQ